MKWVGIVLPNKRKYVARELENVRKLIDAS